MKKKATALPKDKETQADVLLGRLITFSINLENVFDALIAMYYVKPRLIEKFVSEVLVAEHIDFATKFRICNKIGVFRTCYKDIKKDIERLMIIRNQVAHNSIFFHKGKPMIYDNRLEPIEFRPLVEEYVIKAGRVTQSLSVFAHEVEKVRKNGQDKN